MILHCVLSDDRKLRMSRRYALVEKGQDDHVLIRNVSYDPTTASPGGKMSCSQSTLSKLFFRKGLILHML